MAHVFGRASARFHFVAETTGKLHAYQAADPAAFLFDAQTRGAGFSLLPVSPASLTLTPVAGLGTTSWAGQATPFTDGNGAGYRGTFAPSLGVSGRAFMTGQNGANTVLGAYTDDGGATWTGVGQPLGPGSFGYGVAWSENLGLGVMVGSDGGGSVLSTSADLITWAAPSDPFSLPGEYMSAVAVNTAGDLFVAVSNGGGGIFSSPTGAVWTARASLFDGFQINQVRFLNGKWWVAGDGGGAQALASSTNGTAYTPVSSPLDAGVGLDVGYWGGRLYLAGTTNGGLTRVYSTADSGATWRLEATPFDSTGTVFAVAGAGSTGFVAGLTADGLYAVAERDSLGVWLTEETPFSLGNGGALGLLYVAELGGSLGGMFAFGYEGPDCVAFADVVPASLILTPLNG